MAVYYDPDDPSGLDNPTRSSDLGPGIEQQVISGSRLAMPASPASSGQHGETGGEVSSDYIRQIALSQVKPASLLPAVVGGGAAIPAALAGIGAAIPALAGVVGVAGAVYGGLQALGLGEGEGLFGMDLLGGDTQYQAGIPFGGPGLAEPPAQWVVKEWHVNYSGFKLQYYLVQMPSGGRKIAMYSTKTGKWKVWPWRKPHLAVIGKNMPSHKQLTRLKRNLVRHSADARTLLKLTSPGSLASGRRGPPHRYHKAHH